MAAREPIGVSIAVDRHVFEAALKRLESVVSFNPATLMEEIAALGETQTRRRITDEKTAPDGTPWKPNRQATSILLDTGQHLLASIAFTSDVDTAEWGASWQFAHVHQEGAVITPKTAKALAFPGAGGKTAFARKVTIPARPFVGLSDANRVELEELVTDHFERLGR